MIAHPRLFEMYHALSDSVLPFGLPLLVRLGSGALHRLGLGVHQHEARLRHDEAEVLVLVV